MNTSKRATVAALRRQNGRPLKYQAVFFDLDGTLLDSQPCHIAAWDQGAKHTNTMFRDDPPIVITNEFLLYQVGRTNDDAVKFLGIDPLSEKGKIFIKLKRDAAVANAPGARWFPDALATLPLLQERGYKVAIVTSSHRPFVEEALKGHEDLKFLRSQIIARGDYNQGKPKADCLVKACDVSDVSSAEAIYVGDALVDYRTTQAAGCAFLLYSPQGGPVEKGLGSVPCMKSHRDIWGHL